MALVVVLATATLRNTMPTRQIRLIIFADSFFKSGRHRHYKNTKGVTDVQLPYSATFEYATAPNGKNTMHKQHVLEPNAYAD